MKKARKSTLQKQPFLKGKIESCLNYSTLTKKQAKHKELEKDSSDTELTDDFGDVDWFSEPDRDFKIINYLANIAVSSYS